MNVTKSSMLSILLLLFVESYKRRGKKKMVLFDDGFIGLSVHVFIVLCPMAFVIISREYYDILKKC